MSRPVRIALRIGAGLVGLIILLLVVVLIVVQTAWFRSYVRTKIIAYTEEATGGTVELQKFGFDWTQMHAELDGFVLHGTEPPGSAPLFSAKTINVYLTLLPSFHNFYRLDYLGVMQPQVDIIVFPDGHTNVPAPKTKPTSNTTVLEDLVNLAIHKFDITNGTILFAQQSSHFDAHGENLRLQLSYNTIPSTYDGTLSMAPLYLSQDKKSPLNINVNVPMHLERDLVRITNAKIASGDSQILITGDLSHLVQPRETAHINASISLADVKNAVGSALPITIPPNGPGVLLADANIAMDQDHIQVNGARIGLGGSNLEASGALKDPSGNTTLQFKSRLVLAELGRLYKNAFNPQGVVNLNGNAKLVGANNDYFADGNIEARDLSFTQGGTRIRNVDLYSAFDVNKQAIELKGLKLAAFGGTFNGNAGIENMARYHVDGKLAGFDIAEMAQLFANERIGYDGIISGPVQASGDLKKPADVAANVHVTIAPGHRGVPVSGALNASYNGARDSIDLERSYIDLPNSRLDLSGSVGQQLQLRLVSHNLNDFLPAMQMGSKNPPKEMPIALQPGGSATVTATVTGKLNAPHVAGHLALAKFEAQQRPFDSLVADINASSSGASVQNAALTRGSLQAHFNATVGLKNWAAPNYEPITVNATIANADLADIMALSGSANKDISGRLNADAHLTGTIGDPRGAANLNIANVTAYQEHFDQIAGQVTFSDRLITIPDMRLTAGSNRIDVTANYEHAPDSLETGRLHATVASNTLQLAQFEAVKKGTPDLTGTLQINADVNANLSQANNQLQFTVTSANANIGAHGLKFEGNNYGDLTATAQTTGNVVAYNVNSDFAGSTIHATGNTRLAPEYPTTATLNISNLRVERVLAVAGRKDIPFTGVLSTTAQLSGTLNDPRADADLSIANANYYEHFDRIAGHVDYSRQLINIPSLDVVSGSAHAQLTASFRPQPPGQFDAGALTFKLNTNQVQLAQFKTVQQHEPGMAGIVQITADGAATLQNAPGKPRILFSKLDANASATGLALNKKPYGDVKLTANTSGNDVVFNLDSNFAGSTIHGDGRAGLTGDYPVNARLNFANLRYANIRDFFGASDSLEQNTFDVLVDGSATVSGPLTNTAELKASVQLPKLQVSAKSRGTALSNANFETLLQNQGPIVASLDRNVVRVDSARLTGKDTDISVTGTATLQPTQDLNINVNATTNLSLIQQLNRDMYSQGAIVLQASIRGTLSDPSVNGRLQLQNASVNDIDWPLGIDSANGVIVFNGKTATIQTLTAKTGGGDLAATGSATYTNGVASFNLGATANQVRVRYSGASTIANANIKLTGNTDRSNVTGSVTITKISFNPHSDFGSMLSSSGAPVETPSAPSPLLENMHLQIQVQTAPAAAFETTLAQNLQMSANLRITGTAATPGVLGRINVTQGTLVFFGSSYTVDQGVISFYNPLRIQPVLDVNLETKTQGVDVILTVSGPMDDLKLTYRSDPPLPFNEVIALLATGKSPTSDPVLAAHQPPTPPQTTQQMGESAVLGAAVASPVASRLQRVFGVSQLKIAPAFVPGSELPQARMTLQQQVTPDVTFTYITDLTNSNEQVVRAEWSINPRWSAVATRDENGIIYIDFLYKRRLR